MGIKKEKHSKESQRLIRLSRMLFAVCISLLLINMVLYSLYPLGDSLSDALSVAILIIGIILANGLVGLLIISRFPGHMVGWLLLMLGFTLILTTLTSQISAMVAIGMLNPGPSIAAFLDWLSSWIYITILYILLFLLPLYFPDGRLLSRRWALVAVGGLLGIFTGIYFSNPESFVARVLSMAGSILTFVATIGVFLSIILRYRRSGPGQRAQMKWVLFTLVLAIALLFFQEQLAQLNPFLDQFLGKYNFQLFLFIQIALPISIGIAILRYRLYDIDIIIRRTLVYGLLTAVLILIYFGSVIILQSLFGLLIGRESPLVIVASTLLIAAFFNPLRVRIQAWIDRRFYRRKYDAQETLTRFAATLREEQDLERITADLSTIVEETMQPQGVLVWLVNPAER